MKKLLLPALLMAFAFASCQKTNLDKRSENNPNQGDLEAQTQSLQESVFNYDLVGEAHNNYLIYIRSNSNFFDLTGEELYNYGQSYVDPFFGETIQMSYDSMLPILYYTDSLTDNLMENGVLPGEKLVDDSVITEVMKPYVDQLASLFLNAADTSHSPYSSAQFSAMVQNIESQINTNFTPVVDMSDTSANQGATLLCMCAIARYSYSYWSQNYADWSPDQSKPTGLGHVLKAVGHWCGVAGQDALGFLGAGKVGGSASAGTGGVKGNVDYSVSIKDGTKSAKSASAHQRERYDSKG